MGNWHALCDNQWKILNVFNTLTLKQISWKTKTFFKKLEYHFIGESTKIENTSFPCKTAMPEVNVKDTHREKAPANKTPALTESSNMGIWVVRTSNQLFIRGS